MPSLRGLLPFIPGIFVLLVLMRIEVLLAFDVAKRPLNVFSAEKWLEYRLITCLYLTRWVIDGGIGAISIAIVNFVGGGLIHLSDHGWWYLPSFLCFLLAADFHTYVAHRIYHKIPFLWSMHSLHHSATELSATTGGRHFWFESVISGVFFAPVIGVLFVVPANILLPFALINFFVGVLTHFNVPVCLGKLTLWVNNPQWHRVHHSLLPEHRDKNFANLFPVFDLLFGTAWIPAPNEFPATGIDGGDKPATVLEGMIWPLRNVSRRWRALGTGALEANPRP